MTEFASSAERSCNYSGHPSEVGIDGPVFRAESVRKNALAPGFHLLDGGGVAVVRTGPEVDRVDLCMQNPAEWSQTSQRYELLPAGKTRDGGRLFAGAVNKVEEGRPYGFRVSGTYRPPYYLHHYGHLLLDQYAKRIDNYPHSGNRQGSLAGGALYSVTSKPTNELRGDRTPHIDDNKRVIYETHLKGLTMLHPDVPAALRGTYEGAAHPKVLRYLKDLGVTSVEFLPVQQAVSESTYMPWRLPNYWKYNTIGFFAPESTYAATPGRQVNEFKKMVKAYHAAGLEVILDVVYNHTGEGGAGGPVLSFKGYDNAGMYRINRDGNYEDYTGCGNTFDVSRPAALKVVMDSLRYWVTDMHVDGFRFDLTLALARDRYGNIDMKSPFMMAIQRDPVLKNRIIIPEPWDISGQTRIEEMKQGRRLRPWDGNYRDTVRSFWNERGAGISVISDALANPKKSVKFVTAHDGFTLRDLVSYNQKHNDANGEGNRDGESHNRSYNYGVEGETNDPAIRAWRVKAAANMLCTLLLSSVTVTPMIRGGDEQWQTQGGDNNTYCQDNELSWLPWSFTEEGRYMHALTRALLQIRRENDRAGGLTWLDIWGREMEPHEWHNGVEALGAHWAARKVGRDIMLWVNRMDEPVNISVPTAPRLAGSYSELVNTDAFRIDLGRTRIVPNVFTLPPFSTMILGKI